MPLQKTKIKSGTAMGNDAELLFLLNSLSNNGIIKLM